MAEKLPVTSEQHLNQTPTSPTAPSNAAAALIDRDVALLFCPVKPSSFAQLSQDSGSKPPSGSATRTPLPPTAGSAGLGFRKGGALAALQAVNEEVDRAALAASQPVDLERPRALAMRTAAVDRTIAASGQHMNPQGSAPKGLNSFSPSPAMMKAVDSQECPVRGSCYPPSPGSSAFRLPETANSSQELHHHQHDRLSVSQPSQPITGAPMTPVDALAQSAPPQRTAAPGFGARALGYENHAMHRLGLTISEALSGFRQDADICLLAQRERALVWTLQVRVVNYGATGPQTATVEMLQ